MVEPLTVVHVDESDPHNTAEGPSHTLALRLSGRLLGEQAFQHLRADYWAGEWDLGIRPRERNVPADMLTLDWVPDSRREEAVRAVNDALTAFHEAFGPEGPPATA